MKINPSIFSLPPYISTSWVNVVALYVKEGTLCVSMADGEFIEIPELKKEVLDLIFAAHATFLEMEMAREHFTQAKMSAPQSLMAAEANGDSPFRFGFSTMDGFGGALQHNPNQADAPDIPSDILQKISEITKIVSPEISSMPKAESHCNCMFCQISRAVHNTLDHKAEIEHHDEVVSEEDLKFQEWSIKNTGDKLYLVTNKLDSNESYNVYLGEPVGCTCGQQGCPHILAVLKS